MRILVLGGGGREHAIVKALARSPRRPELFCAPGNPGIALEAACLPETDPTDVPAVVRAAADHAIDLVVVGPEAPLVAGVVDALEAAGIPAFGPTRDAARLEGSKTFAKQAMDEVGIPTGSFAVLRDRDEALREIASASFPVVLKADGLLAKCVQHEMDHLDGVLFVDHLSSLKRKIILRKLSKTKHWLLVDIVEKAR